MSLKATSKKVLLTIPKPIHDWLSNEAKEKDRTLQEQIRTVLKDDYEKPTFNESVSLHGATRWTKKPRTWTPRELMRSCDSIGSAVYDVFATERKRLNVIMVSQDGGVLWHKVSENLEVTIPVLTKSFYPVNHDNEIDVVQVCEAAKQIALLENRLLSVCDDGEDVYEAMPFQVQRFSTRPIWKGVFRVCINSAKTPTVADVIKLTSE